ncbi:CAP domain-containing protein [Haloechinothrix halophila]|uniref:CAP domain-containing protein n=1 Tax=Haloechinothrix halophila TaxID=1069073 RepID=UPI000557E01B|nr:CAP domain-containing protein [Haloechinothrix halophila]
MVLGGLTAGGYTVAAGQTDFGAVLSSLSAEIALADASNNGGASAPGAAVSPDPAPTTSSESRQRSQRPTETPTTSKQKKPKPKPKPTTTSPTTSSAAPSPTTTMRTTRQFTVTPDVTTSESEPSSEQASATDRVVRLVNEVRADHGCDAVTVDERIERAASKHSTDMAERNYFSHDTPEGVGFAERIEDEGYSSPGAENIAKGYRTAEDVMDGWMNSDGHRANILNCDLNTIGIGLDTNGWLWTQDFGY